MNKWIVLLLACCIYQPCFAQLFGGEKVLIYGIEFKAKDITGQKRFVGSPDFYRTKILNPLMTKRSDDYYSDIGSYRHHMEKMETLGLFNLSLQSNSYPLLDSIDFDYYKSFGFSEVERQNPSILSDEDYLRFKSHLVGSSELSIKEKKEYLFSAKPLYRNMLLMSRYEIYNTDIEIDKKKISKFASELKAQLDTIKINSNAEVGAKVRAYLSRLADESTIVKGFYVDARLHSAYIQKINYYINTTPDIDKGTDEFSYNLKNYRSSKNAAANTSLVAIQLNGTFDKTNVNIDSLSADLASKFQIPASEATKIAASVNLAFTKSETLTFQSKFNNVFIVRYFTSSVIDDL